jgi:GGDEF domain-containing protein
LPIDLQQTVISIKKFLSQNNDEANDEDRADPALMHVVRGLVQGIGEHAVAGDPEDCARFRESIRVVSEDLAGEISSADLLVHTGSVLKALEGHNRRTARHQRLQTAELQHMVQMLTSAVGAVSALSEANIGRLNEIEKQVASASELGDVRVIKAKLSDCLCDIQKEAERQRKETGDTIVKLSLGLNHARKQAAEIAARDPVTGLPRRPEAEGALAEAVRMETNAFAAVLVLDRLQILNNRFGREVGDEILVAFTRHVQKLLTPEDQLFRWSGTALLAFLPRESGIERVRGEVGRMMETRLEHTIQTPSRSILLPVAARWSLFSMITATRLMYQKIDTFAALPVARD